MTSNNNSLSWNYLFLCTVLIYELFSVTNSFQYNNIFSLNIAARVKWDARNTYLLLLFFFNNKNKCIKKIKKSSSNKTYSVLISYPTLLFLSNPSKFFKTKTQLKGEKKIKKKYNGQIKIKILDQFLEKL